MERPRLKPAWIIAAAASLVPLVLVLGAPAGRSQESAAPKAQAKQAASQATIESHDRTNFPLVGRHRTLSCRECHVNLVFEGTPRDCEVCHWQRRQDDRYSLRLGTRCADCHTPQAWKKVDPSAWNHERDAGYRLEGVHRTLDCEVCHGSNGFVPQPTACFSCHEADYRGTRDPDHVQAGFPTDCPSCHDQRAWDNASFSHTQFPLQGRHASAHCSDCHKNGVYAGTSTACASCHLADYNGTTDPNHRAAGFPLNCDQCHGTSFTGWSGANFNHPFPITSGRHAGVACSECHQTSDFRVFTCLGCHEQASTNSHHSGVTGYSYNSQACYACHPNGSGSPSSRPRTP
ncbi:MAG TPA: cytochrome c3 family protein [Acidobacteriota bacterium]|nr:cytochrome c3 family protein [Acidobacteriota bacterium]